MTLTQRLATRYVAFCDDLPDRVWHLYSKLPLWFHRHTYGRAENKSLNNSWKAWPND